jgi:SSS family transporter
VTALDWAVVTVYIVFIVLLGWRIGLRQKNQNDYYLGGKTIAPWKLGTSLAANQVSAISLVSAPAFIALRDGGGMIWLQYEMAVPLAMIVLIVVFVPALRSTRGTTIYQYLEERFGPSARWSVSLVFLVSRSLATGIALLTTSYVTSVCLGLDTDSTILLIGIVSLVYTSLGGFKADIVSDILQLVILWGAALSMLILLLADSGWKLSFPASQAGRFEVFDFASTGIMDGATFSFWPMLFGGLFLYVSYYGCDQSQAQRLLAARDDTDARRALLVNGFLRFPVVLTYCCIGVLLIGFLESNPDFRIEAVGRDPDLLVPAFVLRYVPAGLTGLIVAGIFAASMSSIDSAMNSLSASTWNDVMLKVSPSLGALPQRKKVFISRALTVWWGVFAAVAALSFHRISGNETVIELVNKVGSAFYGPIAAVFFMGVVSKRGNSVSAVTGLGAGICINMVLWGWFPGVSWLWWNVAGCAGTLFAGFVTTRFCPRCPHRRPDLSLPALKDNMRFVYLLAFWFAAIFLFSLLGHLFVSRLRA